MPLAKVRMIFAVGKPWFGEFARWATDLKGEEGSRAYHLEMAMGGYMQV